ncbi:MAG: hypothetical protein KCHDKBKB_02593 [Elusimicrobia bacterium]|nr:hypothetical protein [Elusimicrobiota bacterium]
MKWANDLTTKGPVVEIGARHQKELKFQLTESLQNKRDGYSNYFGVGAGTDVGTGAPEVDERLVGGGGVPVRMAIVRR